LLSGKRVGVGGGLADVDTASLSNTWMVLRAARPAAFSTTPEEIVFWHREEADRTEQGGLLFASEFHRRWLQRSESKKN
jgi:hypothetical protein